MTKMSSSASSFSSDDQLSNGNKPYASPKHGGEVQSTETRLGAEAQNPGEAPAGEDIQLNLDYAHGLRSIFTVADEWVLQHNLDIP